MTCSFIGFGNFSRAISIYLKPHFDLFAYDINEDLVYPEFINKVTVKEALSKDIVILSIPVQYLKDFLVKNVNFFKSDSIVLDTCSVKLRPFEYMKEYLPAGVHSIGTHPLFGPQSIKDFLNGHRIVFTNEFRNDIHYAKVKKFCENKLNLVVIEMSSEEHDREMARVQALNHFIVRGLQHLDLTDSAVATPSYTRLFELFESLRHDSDDLFYTIQRENPFADDIRKRYISALRDIDLDVTSKGGEGL